MIHTFECVGYFVALDVESGAVHLLDSAAYDVLNTVTEQELRNGTMAQEPLKLYEKHGKNVTLATFGELSELVAQGTLYSVADYSKHIDKLGIAPVKAMCLHIAHDCNLRCRYCFASTGNFGGKRTLMSAEVAHKAIDLLIEASGSRHNLEVDFFGGEPLMNFDVVKSTVDYARSREKIADKRFRFTLTTNGIALNSNNIAYINEEMSNVVLSLDGRKQINDDMRKIPGGGSCYDEIVPKYQQLIAGRGDKEYYVRGTYTRHNTDFDADVLEMFNLGFEQISVEPVVGPEKDDYTIRKSDIEAISQSYKRLLQRMISAHKAGERQFNFFHFMLDFSAGPCAIKRLKGCGCGNEYLAVTPEGDLYPCHQFVGDESFVMGTVYEGITQPQMKEAFAAAHLLNKVECAECWCKYYCSGGCNANNHSLRGDILKPHELSCELEKIRLEYAIALQIAKAVG